MAAERAAGTDPVVENVRAASDIVEVVGQYVSLKKVGRTWKGLCPFHQEKTPSFIVTPERQTYHCFGCGQGGDVFRFVQEVEKVGFGDALRQLADRAGIRLPARRGEREGAPLAEACEAAATLYRRFLDDPGAGRAARDFLAARGIEEKVRQRFGLGYAPEGWDALSSRLASRFGEPALVGAGLAVARERGGVYDRFRDRLMVPLRTPNGRVIGFGGRILGPGEPKYLNSPETALYQKGRFVFGLGEAREGMRQSGEAVLVEGYFDVLALHQAGVEDAIACAGTAVTEEQGALIHRTVGKVCLALDGDAAGQAAARKALAPLMAAGLDVRVVTLPAGEDPDSFVRREGAEAFARRRAEAVSPVEFLCKDAVDDASRAAARHAVVELAKSVKDTIVREGLLEAVDRRLALRDSSLPMLRRAAQEGGPVVRARSPVAEPAAPRPAATPPTFAERSLVALLVAQPELVSEALAAIDDEWLRHPWMRATWEAMGRAPAAGVTAWMAALPADAAAWLSAVAARAEEPPEPRRALEDLQRTFRMRALQAELADAQRRVATPGEERAWLQRTQELRAELTQLQHAFSDSKSKGAGE